MQRHVFFKIVPCQFCNVSRRVLVSIRTVISTMIISSVHTLKNITYFTFNFRMFYMLLMFFFWTLLNSSNKHLQLLYKYDKFLCFLLSVRIFHTFHTVIMKKRYFIPLYYLTAVLQPAPSTVWTTVKT